MTYMDMLEVTVLLEESDELTWNFLYPNGTNLAEAVAAVEKQLPSKVRAFFEEDENFEHIAEDDSLGYGYRVLSISVTHRIPVLA